MNEFRQYRPGSTRRRRIATALGMLAIGLAAAACEKDVATLPDEKVINFILPDRRVDTSFVGDQITYEVPYFFAATDEVVALTGFDINWSSDKPSIAVKNGPALQAMQVRCFYPLVSSNCIQSISVSIDAVGPGDAMITMVPTVVKVAEGVSFQHRVFVLASPPSILDAPSIVRLKVGGSTQLRASPINEANKQVTTGKTTFIATQPAIASVEVFQTFNGTQFVQEWNAVIGGVESAPTLPVTIKGVAVGQGTVNIKWTSNKGLTLEKVITVIVVPPSITIVAGGPSTDRSNSLTPVPVNSTRQYSAVDEVDAALAATWNIVPQSPTIADITASGLATCRAGGTAQVKAERTGPVLSQIVSLVCVAPLPPVVTVSPSTVTLASNQSVSLAVAVQNVASPYTIKWTSDEPLVAIVQEPSNLPSVVVLAANNVVRTGSAVHVNAVITSGTVTTSNFASITVGAAPVAILPNQPSIAVGTSRTLTLNTTDGASPPNSTGIINNTEVTWSSGTAPVASVVDGVVTCLTVGFSNITAILKNTTRAGITTLSCTALAAPPVASIVLSPLAATTTIGTPVQYRVTYKDAGGISVNAEAGSTTVLSVPTAPPVIATIAANSATTWLLTPVAVGTTQVVATYTAVGRAPVTTSTPVTITASPVSTLVLDGMAAELSRPGGMKFVAHLFDALGVEVTTATEVAKVVFSVDNPTILSVSNLSGTKGQATSGAFSGGAMVTATYGTQVSGGPALPFAASPVLVYPQAGALYTSVALAMSVGGDVNPAAMRQLTVGQDVTVELVIKNPSNTSVGFNVNQGIAFLASSNVLTTPVHVGDLSLLQYKFRATALPATSAIVGVPNVVTLQVDIDGAMIKIPFIVRP